MGYTTHFTGTLTITPPLNPTEIHYLTQFSDTRRMQRTAGPYYIGRDETDVLNSSQPPADQPGLWCDWAPTPDGTGLQWNGAEKTYRSVEWVRYLIDHFLKPRAVAAGQPGFEAFTFDHVVSGEVRAQGDLPDDQWTLLVADNVVSQRDGVAADAEQPYTDEDVRAEAARQHALLTADPDFMGVGEQMQDQPCPATDEPGPGLHTWGDLPHGEFVAAQRKIDDLIGGAADVSAWAVQLGADGLQPEDHTLSVDADGRTLVRLHCAFHPEFDDGARARFVAGLARVLADGL